MNYEVGQKIRLKKDDSIEWTIEKILYGTSDYKFAIFIIVNNNGHKTYCGIKDIQ